MSTDVHLLSVSEVEGLLQRPERYNSFSPILLCTVMEPLEAGEKIRKQKPGAGSEDFKRRWKTLLEQASNLIVGPLDDACLARSLFRYSEPFVVLDLWPEVIAEGLTAEGLIARLVRRLILRPSDETWWDEEPYHEMESWYESGSDRV
ncbi:MAG: hypothetical protein HZY76_12005 [Anaerolineae bacterium]|nr:MAG: hypothetical protein HZY76_12005 [Anaerolineae bacterium]